MGREAEAYDTYPYALLFNKNKMTILKSRHFELRDMISRVQTYDREAVSLTTYLLVHII